uniref:Ig-like domain-containing protein n=1 Tax=Astyanax mexicanus TaxID=7994 RepID=A0A3B1ISD9_ASTMX
MATRQLWIISLVLCSALPSAATVNWKLTVTNNIQAYQHDCVIINCTFEYNNCTEEQKKIQSTPEKGIWMKKEGMDVNLYHPNSSQIHSDFRGRTELLGNISQKNCTLKINNLRKTDAGQYIFRVEGITTKGGICHYRYIEQPVKLKVFNKDTRPVITMDEVKVGSLATVTCSINYTCVSNPPDLNWSHEQRENDSIYKNRHGDQWILTSILTFQTQESDLDTMINCTAKYNLSSSGYEEKKESTLLKLGYPPRIKEESACSKNQCVCVVDSRPPSVIRWLSSDGKSVISNISAKEYKVEYELNILDVNVGVLYCEAINRHGKSTVSFSLGSSLGFLYIVISGFAVLIIILLAAIFYMWRFRIQKEKWVPFFCLP